MKDLSRATTVTLRLPFDASRSFEITGSNRDESIPSMIRASGGWYEPEVMRRLHAILPPDGVALDIGANLGAIALAMSALAREGKVFAFEPVPETFAFLEQNLAANRVTNVVAIHRGCFSSSRAFEFHYIEEFGGGAFLSPVGVSDPREKRATVECVTVDSFVEEQRLDRLDVMKIDVEGSEDDVLAGGERTCRSLRPMLLVEFNPKASEVFFGRSLEGLYERLRSFGYTPALIERPAGTLWRVPDYRTLLERIERQGGVGDLLCTPLAPLPR